jgi:hypothetical protein
MIVTLAPGLPRMGRPSIGIASAGSLSRSKVSMRARVRPSFDSKKLTTLVRPLRLSVTGRVR